MLFTSLQYALFLPTIVLAYYLLPSNFRVITLLLGSYIFYTSWNWMFLPLIIGLTIANYYLGWLQFSLKEAERNRLTKLVLASSIVINLAVLCFFKYIQFILSSFSTFLNWGNTNNANLSFSVILPLGISFFIFEFIHYQVDIGRGKPPIKSFLGFAVFASFFPTQIAGPIKRYEDFVPQLNLRAVFSWENIGQGLGLILTGLFKKLVLADNLSGLVILGFEETVSGKTVLNLYDAWFLVLAFGFQIYFDFSGYTDMGRGSARMLGYQVPENFHFPYLAINPSDFWRRWHISLSTWLRDYLYIPLGGNRRGRYRNLLITMTLGGLWHGANWTFVVWGAYHGVLLAIYWGIRGRFSQKIKRTNSFPASFVSWFVTFILVITGWVFFRSQNFSQSIGLLQSLYFGNQLNGIEIFSTVEKAFIMLVVVGSLWFEYWLQMAEKGYTLAAGSYRFLTRYSPIGYSLILILLLLFRPNNGARFIYFQF